jgi:hypothetical protein
MPFFPETVSARHVQLLPPQDSKRAAESLHSCLGVTADTEGRALSLFLFYYSIVSGRFGVNGSAILQVVYCQF